MVRYPKQKEIVWIDFNPSSGKEINKRRPAVVVSRTEFNHATGFCVCCPVTSTLRKFPGEVSITSDEIEGHLLTDQLRSFDYISRDIQLTGLFVTEEEWVEIYNKVQLIF